MINGKSRRWKSERKIWGFQRINSALHTRKTPWPGQEKNTEVTVPGGDLGSQGRAPALRGVLGPW